MRFDAEKKKTIIMYLLEKIRQGSTSAVQDAVEVFNINLTTVYSYLKELIDCGVIIKIKRGEYKLVTEENVYTFKRSAGELDSDTFAYYVYFQNHIKDFAPNVKEIWLYALSEMVNNVIDHSLSEDLKIIVEQDYLYTTAYIMDSGVGIFNKIKEHFKLPSLEDAICELFKGKLTTDSSKHSGEGIFFSSKMMDRFYIFSSGKVFTTNKFENSIVLNINDSLGGTCVVMTLSNYTHKKAGEIFDLYADVDGGFSKTKITLKNIFETSPVSRSQAKRVCNRLDKFEEVIFDFEDVEWMGQGFAHQIFAVFAKEHPGIKFTLINANDSIVNMYNHIINTKN